MNAFSPIAAEAQRTLGDTIRARVTNAICRLQDAAERDVPSANRARNLAARLTEALNRPSEQPILDGPNADLSVAHWLWREYRYAIDNICAEQGGWRAPLSSFADAVNERAVHPTMNEVL